MDDFNGLEFVQLDSILGRENFTGFEDDGFQGIPCIKCKDDCPGFVYHPWRRGCGNCKCPFWEHEISGNGGGHPFDRMCVEEGLPPLTSEYDTAVGEGYSWVPRGLSSNEIDKFMSLLPAHKVPRTDSEGANYRARQLLFQLPRQDFSPKYAKFLKDAALPSFYDTSQERHEDALGIGAVKLNLSISKQCQQCNSAIGNGETGVFSPKAGESKCWHPGCFQCADCGELLVDLISFFQNGKLYCGRHYSELIKPRCAGCEEMIYVGEFTKAMDQSWHIEHFACRHCDLPLTGKKYVVHYSQPYCEQCFTNNVAQRCFACNKPIGPESKHLFVKEKHYHKECLTCSKCRKQLQSQSFVCVNDDFVCNGCRGVELPKSCAQCKEEFLAEEKKIGVKEGNLYFHEWCFLCSRCKQPIGTQKFVRKGDGTQICNGCYEQNLQDCVRCGIAIKGNVVKFESSSFHPECFVCEQCKQPLAGQQFYKNNNDPFCEPCYLRYFGKRCEACYTAIKGNSKFIDYNGNYFHNDCFICTKCEKPLAGSKFLTRDNLRYCTDCK